MHAALRPTRGSPETDGGKKGPVVFMKSMVAKECFFFAHFTLLYRLCTDYIPYAHTVCIFVVCIYGKALYCYAGNAEPHPVVILEMALVLVV